MQKSKQAVIKDIFLVKTAKYLQCVSSAPKINIQALWLLEPKQFVEVQISSSYVLQ